MKNLLVKISFILCTLLLSVNSVWGKYFYAQCAVESKPAVGGFVSVWRDAQEDDTYSFVTETSDRTGTMKSGYKTSGTSSASLDFFGYQVAAPGYTFQYWSTDPNAASGITEQQDHTYNWWTQNCKYYRLSVTATSTNENSPTVWKYYAFFTPNNYTVNFDANGGSVTPASKTVTYDATYGTLPAAPNVARTGYTFAGWWTAASGGTQITASTTVKITSAQTLYAHWTPKTYTVTLKPNGGTPNTDQTVTATYAAAMPTGSIAARTKTGYTFAGYYDNASAGTKYYNADLSSAKNWDKASNANLYAHWTANTYTIAYDANGGTGTTSSSTHTYDVAKALTTNGYSKTGYSFVGWATSKALADAGTKAYNDGQSVTNLSATQGATVTLYAIWTANPYTITLNNQSATTAGTPSIAVTFDANTNLTSAITKPTKTGCTFEGYYTAANGGGTQIINKDGNVIASVSGYTDASRNWKYANNIELYAYWKQNQTINWTLPDGAGVEYTTGQEMGAVAYGDYSLAPSGLEIAYSTEPSSVATIVDGKLNVLIPNATVTVCANQGGNHDYNAAAVTVCKTFTTAGCTPDGHSVTATNIKYGQTLASSTLSGTVTAGGVAVAGTLSWVEPTTAPNAGTYEFPVLFTPTNTAVYGSITFNVSVTVNKVTPVITWNITSILRENVRYGNFVESSNKETELSTSSSNSTLLNVSGNVLLTGEVASVQTGLTITVSQAASLNYNAVSVTETFALYPKSGACLPFDPLTEPEFNEAKAAQDGSVAWCGTNEDGHETFLGINVTYTQRDGIALGRWDEGLSGISAASFAALIATGKFKYSDKSVDLFFSGIPENISFDVEVQSVSTPGITWPVTAKNWELYESSDGVTYGAAIATLSDNGHISHSLNENTRYVRIKYTGNFTSFVKNLVITQKRSFTADKSSLTFGTEAHPLQEPQTITLTYSSIGACGATDDAINIASSNPAFYVDEPTITENVGVELKGSYTIRVRCNDVNKSGTLTFSYPTTNEGTKTYTVSVNSAKPAITTTPTAIFQTGTEHAPASGTSYRALRTHDFSGCFNGAPVFDTLYIYGVSESSAANRQWSYDASKGYKVPAVTASNVHTPCFVYKKEGAQYTYARTFDASTKTLNVADSKKRGFVGYRAEAPAANAIQVSDASAEIYLNNTEIVASGAPLAVNATSKVYANGTNILSSTSNAAVQLSGATTLSIEDTWTGATSAILALRPATSYPSIDLGSASGRVDIKGTQLELHNATNMAIAHMDGTTEKYDGEVHINDGSVGGAATLGMPKATFIDGGTFNDGTVAAYTLKGVAKRPRNSRGEMLIRRTMTPAALAAGYDWYGQTHLTLDGSAKVNPMLMDEEVWIFTGNNGEDYDDSDSWNKDGVPDENDDVLINAPMIIASGEMKVKSLTINWENKGKGIPAVTVNPAGGLTVGEGGIDALKVESPVDNLVLKADNDPSSATKGQTGFLRVHPSAAEPMPQATVELFTTAYFDMSVSDYNYQGEWQYVGSPLVAGASAMSVFKKNMIYSWVESTGEWINNKASLELTPFVGYAITQYRDPKGLLIKQAGALAANENVDLPLTCTLTSKEKGLNVFANSFTAPIDITLLETSDFSDKVDATINLFNTGSEKNIEELGDADVDVTARGQYISIPVKNAVKLASEYGYPTVIPAMQGFYVTTEKAGTLTLDYTKLVWGANYAVRPNTPLHAKAQDSNSSVVNGALRVSLSTDDKQDNVYLLESEDYSAEYENGYDAHKLMSADFNIFTIANEDKLSVDATNSLAGTRIGVRTGEEMIYIMNFSHLRSETELALVDNETNQKININEGTIYPFYAAPNSEITDRFQIVARNDAPTVTTGVDGVTNETKAYKFIKDGQMYILKNGVLYNATGAIVR